jgi:hypothetical protein
MDITEILTNPLVWGVLAWLFSRLFTSKNKEEPPTKQPNHQENRPRTNPKPVRNKGEDRARKEVESTLQTVQQAYENMKSSAVDHIEDGMDVQEQPIKTLKDKIPTVNRNVNQKHLIVDRQKAVQGLVWSEILGAPRSKNPHYTRKSRHS